MEVIKTEHAKMKLLITIIDNGSEKELTELYMEHQVPFHLITHGHGTATSEILDYLCLGETKKNIVLSLIKQYQVNHIFSLLDNKMHFSSPGKGVAFTLPLSCISSIVPHLKEFNLENVYKLDSEVNTVKQEKLHELIITIVTQGYSDEAMEAAKAAGATGGTVVHARGLGSQEAQKFLGITIQPEKDLVLIIAKKEDKHAIMESVNKAVGISTKGKGIMFAIPVDETIGLEI